MTSKITTTATQYSSVIDRLRKKRSSHQELSESYPLDIDLPQFLMMRKKKEEKQKLIEKDTQVLDILEKIEKKHPRAMTLFIDEAKRQGIYRPQKNSYLSRSVLQSPQGIVGIKPRLNRYHETSSTPINNQQYYNHQNQQAATEKFILFDIDKKESSDEKFNYYMNKLTEEEDGMT